MSNKSSTPNRRQSQQSLNTLSKGNVGKGFNMSSSSTNGHTSIVSMGTKMMLTNDGGGKLIPPSQVHIDLTTDNTDFNLKVSSIGSGSGSGSGSGNVGAGSGGSGSGGGGGTPTNQFLRDNRKLSLNYNNPSMVVGGSGGVPGVVVGVGGGGNFGVDMAMANNEKATTAPPQNGVSTNVKNQLNDKPQQQQQQVVDIKEVNQIALKFFFRDYK